MVGMVIFTDDAFRTVELTEAASDIDFVPGLLGELGIFEEEPLYGREFGVERKGNTLAMVPTSSLGAPPRNTPRDPRNLETFNTIRLADSFTLYAFEIQGIRDDGPDGGLLDTQIEYASRLGKVKSQMDLTHEFHRLGALQGKLLDADGTSVIYDYFERFGIAEEAAFNFDLANQEAKLRHKCHELTRSMARSAKGAFTSATSVHALCGDEFYDNFIDHPSVQKTYENWSAAAESRENKAFGAFRFGGVTWHNYRGTDDNSTVAIATDHVKFFPKGARGVFKKALSPAEFGPWVGTRGQENYVLNVTDKDREAWAKGEMYSYPLYMCGKPGVLRRGTA